jgi:OOP family OmpA-OmpF porin
MTAISIGKASAALGAILLLGFGPTGCATRKYARNQVAPVAERTTANEKKIADHSSAISEVENNLSRTDEKATTADKKAAAAGEAAAKANDAAGKANDAATQAASKADSAREAADKTGTRLDTVTENIDNYKLVTTERVLFPFGKSVLTKEAKDQLTQAVSQIGNTKHYILEVQGFTDKTGSPTVNLTLSEKRADVVVRYLTVENNIPIRRIHVLGVGADQPVADNKTREGRKENRRVELKLYALDLANAGSQTTASSK